MNNFELFMPDGGWCWFQDPRAVVQGDWLVIGGVEGHGAGAAVAGVYDLRQRTSVGRAVLNPAFDPDDHNAPAFFARPDDRLLAVYARHHREPGFRVRLSEPNDPLRWGPERRVETGDPVTYANLHELSEEGTLYNFYRGIQWNPTFVTSRDGGATWSPETHFVASELEGRHRPYARFAGNGRDVLHLAFTDGHPRNFGNSIYYAAFRGGRFCRADGTPIKSLRKDGPLRPSEAERVFRGSGRPGGDAARSAPSSAWVSSVALDAAGHPHIAYSLYLSNTDHRYRVASWNGRRWLDREIAYAGKCLYDLESSYTGLIELDPSDPAHVVISTDVDPATGADRGGTHEIYRARVGPDDDVGAIIWEPVTRDSPKGVRNLRPKILNWNGYRIVLWQRGAYTTYTDYRLDTVGILETVH